MRVPAEIYQELSEHIVGQDSAKKVLSNAMYSHYLRCRNLEEGIEKSNILLIGPTGTGKTLFAKTLAKIMKLPIAIADATSLTQAGYVGEDVENCVLRLIQNANGNVELASKGIIFIDEIDKIGRKQESASITRDVSGEGVQQALLKIIEGAVINVPASGGRKSPYAIDYIPIDTSNILFICAGAFEGLSHKEKVSPADLHNFGMLPELLGRLPIISKLDPLEETDLLHILTEPENAILQQYKKLFKLGGCELVFEDNSLKAIAKYAIGKGLGARGLRSILETVLVDGIFSLGSIDHYVINEFKVYESLKGA